MGAHGVDRFPAWGDANAGKGRACVYGLPALEYPGHVKICMHSGVEGKLPTWEEEEEEDEHPVIENDDENEDDEIRTLQTYVKNRFPLLDPSSPSIMETCWYTVTPDWNFVIGTTDASSNSTTTTTTTTTTTNSTGRLNEGKKERLTEFADTNQESCATRRKTMTKKESQSGCAVNDGNKVNRPEMPVGKRRFDVDDGNHDDDNDDGDDGNCDYEYDNNVNGLKTGNVIYAVGFSGMGFKMAPVVGETLADIVEGKQTKIDLEKFSPHRFRSF